MAIQPIDLQALFAQLGTVGKNQAAIREGQQMQAAIHNTEVQKKLEENHRSVNEAQEMGKEAATIKEQSGGGAQAGGGKGQQKQQEDEAPAEAEKAELFWNPALGRNIDISG